MNRRSIIKGLAFIAAAPAIVRASSLMPAKVLADNLPHGGVVGDDTHFSGWTLSQNGESTQARVDEMLGDDPSWRAPYIVMRCFSSNYYGNDLITP